MPQPEFGDANGAQTVAWLASFPRSGNTWLRAMLSHMIATEADPLVDMQRIIPDLYGTIDEANLRSRNPLIIKAHDPFDAAVAQLQQFGVAIAAHRPILIVRNPLDVIVSSFDFAVLNDGKTYAKLSTEQLYVAFNKFVDEFIEQNGRTPQYNYSSEVDLLEHASSWLAAVRTEGGTIVRYEDLIADAPGALDRVVRFLGIPGSPEGMRQAVERCRFGALRRLEDAHIGAGIDKNNEFFCNWRTSGYVFGRRFFNEGRAGRGVERLTAEQALRVRHRFAPIFQEFGYQR